MIDASVAVKWVVEEDHSANAALLLGYDTLYAPAHWRAEAVNVLWAKVFRGDLTAVDAWERMLVLNRAPVVETAIAGLVPRAFAISVAHSVTVYDSLYVALAEQRGIPFVTADERLVRRLAGDADLGNRLVWVGTLAGS
nr:type II toxin-antitoxin system VapC family toxin [uncultured Rhodopila sp.]